MSGRMTGKSATVQVQIMWDTMEYVHEVRDDFEELVRLLRAAGHRNASQRKIGV